MQGINQLMTDIYHLPYTPRPQTANIIKDLEIGVVYRTCMEKKEPMHPPQKRGSKHLCSQTLPLPTIKEDVSTN